MLKFSILKLIYNKSDTVQSTNQYFFSKRKIERIPIYTKTSILKWRENADLLKDAVHYKTDKISSKKGHDTFISRE